MVIVLMSAWIPAPPQESDPAIVNAFLIIISFPNRIHFCIAAESGAPGLPLFILF
jgi:hypothetical protein